MGASCKSCGLPIRWAETSSGKKMPLDVEPSQSGRVVMEYGKARVLHRGDDPEGQRYTCHFDTCTKASQHRSGGGGGSSSGPRPRSSSSRSGAPAPNPVTAIVEAVRGTVWQIKSGPDPDGTAQALFAAACQVLLERGRTVVELQDLVAREVRP